MNMALGRHDERDEEFARRMKTLLDGGNEALDVRVLSRLARGRHEALQYALPSPALWLRQWAPAAGLAAATVVAMLLWPIGEEQGAMPLGVIDDLEIVENLELYEELEFYAWIGEQPDLG